MAKQEVDIVVFNKRNKRLIKNKAQAPLDQSPDNNDMSYQLKQVKNKNQLRKGINNGRECVENNSIDRLIATSIPLQTIDSIIIASNQLPIIDDYRANKKHASYKAAVEPSVRLQVEPPAPVIEASVRLPFEPPAPVVEASFEALDTEAVYNSDCNYINNFILIILKLLNFNNLAEDEEDIEQDINCDENDPTLSKAEQLARAKVVGRCRSSHEHGCKSKRRSGKKSTLSYNNLIFKIDYKTLSFKICELCGFEEICEPCFLEKKICSMCVAEEEISKTETKRSDELAEKNFLRDSQLRELENKVKSFSKVDGRIDLTGDEKSEILIVIDDDEKPNDISGNYNNFIDNIETYNTDDHINTCNFDNIEECNNNNNIADEYNNIDNNYASTVKLLQSPITFNSRIGALPDEIVNYVADFVPKKFVGEESQPITSRPGDNDFNPIIAVVGNKVMENGEACFTYRDSLRLSSDVSLKPSEKFMNDSVLFGLTTINFMKRSKKYGETVTYGPAHFFQVIGYEREVLVSNDIKYDMLTKGKTSRDFQNFFKTIAFCFFVFLNTHISFWSILFLRSLFYVDFVEAEVCSYYLKILFY